jgi:hypothetical protein
VRPLFTSVFCSPKAELREAIRRPPVGAGFPRGLTHHEATALAEESHGALRCRGRASEPPRHDEVKCPAELGPPRQLLGPSARDGRAIGDLELPERPFEKAAPPVLGVEKRPGRCRPGDQEGETRDTTPRAQVEEPPREAFPDRGCQRLGVFHVERGGSRTNEPALACRFQQAGYALSGLGGQHCPPADQPGRITTRRLGSSPSEIVVTPSISATTSCTTFRSGAPIGSSTCSVPSSRT